MESDFGTSVVRHLNILGKYSYSVFFFFFLGKTLNSTYEYCKETVDGPVCYCDTDKRWDTNTSTCVGEYQLV